MITCFALTVMYFIYALTGIGLLNLCVVSPIQLINFYTNYAIYSAAIGNAFSGNFTLFMYLGFPLSFLGACVIGNSLGLKPSVSEKREYYYKITV